MLRLALGSSKTRWIALYIVTLGVAGTGVAGPAILTLISNIAAQLTGLK